MVQEEALDAGRFLPQFGWKCSCFLGRQASGSLVVRDEPDHDQAPSGSQSVHGQVKDGSPDGLTPRPHLGGAPASGQHPHAPRYSRWAGRSQQTSEKHPSRQKSASQWHGTWPSWPAGRRRGRCARLPRSPGLSPLPAAPERFQAEIGCGPAPREWEMLGFRARTGTATLAGTTVCSAKEPGAVWAAAWPTVRAALAGRPEATTRPHLRSPRRRGSSPRGRSGQPNRWCQVHWHQQIWRKTNTPTHSGVFFVMVSSIPLILVPVKGGEAAIYSDRIRRKKKNTPNSWYAFKKRKKEIKQMWAQQWFCIRVLVYCSLSLV